VKVERRVNEILKAEGSKLPALAKTPFEKDKKRRDPTEVVALLNALTDVSVDDFDSRLKLQKLSYLAWAVGLNYGLAFNWYVRGPYSPTLTRILFNARDLGTLQRERVQLRENEKKAVRKLKRFLGKDISDPRSLELIASVWYFLPPGEVTGKQKKEVIERVRAEKPELRLREIEETVNRILRFTGR